MSHQSKHLYEFGPFRLDAAERLLLRDGETVPLTPKAFDLLLALMLRWTKVVVVNFAGYKSEVEMFRIPVNRVKIAEFCRKHHIRRLAFFGSVLREDFRPDSDVDVLVEFEPEHTPGLAFFTMEAELSEILGRKVDLNTPQFVSPRFRDQVLAESLLQYEQA